MSHEREGDRSSGASPASPPTQPPGHPAHVRRHPEKRDGPRRVRHGLKLQEIVDFSALTGRQTLSAAAEARTLLHSIDLVQQWLALMQARFDVAALVAGFEYAQSGQVMSLDFSGGSGGGAIEAQVQGSSPRPYTTRLLVPTFSAEQWDRLIDSMAAEAVYVAKLLTGELPPALDELLARLGLTLLPQEQRDQETKRQTDEVMEQRDQETKRQRDEVMDSTSSLRPSLSFACTCAEPGPCKHAAAVAYLVAERLAEHPLSIFTLLGMPAERMLERLRRARTIHTHGVASAHADPMIPESQVEPPPLEACLGESAADFWRHGPQLAELEHRPPPHHAPHALLRRLGPSPLAGKFPMAGLLASVYDTVTSAMKRMREEVEGPTSASEAADDRDGASE